MREQSDFLNYFHKTIKIMENPGDHFIFAFIVLLKQIWKSWFSSLRDNVKANQLIFSYGN